MLSFLFTHQFNTKILLLIFAAPCSYIDELEGSLCANRTFTPSMNRPTGHFRTRFDKKKMPRIVLMALSEVSGVKGF